MEGRTHGVLTSLLTVSILLGGCGSVEPKPFDDYAKATGELRQSADKLLEENHGMARARFVRETEATTDRNEFFEEVRRVKLDHPGGDAPSHAWTMPEKAPLFVEVARYRSAVDDFNAVLTRYTTSLAELAGPTSLTEEKLDALASSLTTNVRNAAKSLGIGNLNEDKLGLFGGAALALFKAYIESKQRGHLSDALEANQPWIEEVSRLGSEAVRNLATATWQELKTLQSHLEQKFLTSRTRKDLESWIKLNSDFAARFEALKTLDEAYQQLPDAHADLAKGLEQEVFSLAAVENLVGLAKRIDRLRKASTE